MDLVLGEGTVGYLNMMDTIGRRSCETHYVNKSPHKNRSASVCLIEAVVGVVS